MAKFNANAVLDAASKEDSKLYHSFEEDTQTAFMIVPFNEREMFIKYEQFQDPNDDKTLRLGRSVMSLGPKSYFAKNGVLEELGYPSGMKTDPIKELFDKVGIKQKNREEKLVPARPSPGWYCMVVPVAKLHTKIKGSGWTACESVPLIKGTTVKKGKSEAPQLYTQLLTALKTLQNEEGDCDFVLSDASDIDTAKCLLVTRTGSEKNTVYKLKGFSTDEDDCKIVQEEINLSDFLDVDQLEEELETAAQNARIEVAYSNLLLSYAELEAVAEEVGKKLGKTIDLECFRLKREQMAHKSDTVAESDVDFAVDGNDLDDDDEL